MWQRNEWKTWRLRIWKESQISNQRTMKLMFKKEGALASFLGRCSCGIKLRLCTMYSQDSPNPDTQLGDLGEESVPGVM